MNRAIIIAGGVGKRMNQEIPKQFINVYDKPVIMYTLQGFQEHPQIDEIGVVCIEGWEDVVWAYAKQYGIDKLKWIIKGGNTAQESIRNGVYYLESIGCDKDDIVVIHDGIRPLIEPSVLSDVINKCGEAYNIADEKSDIRLRDLAETIAESVGKKVVFDVPSKNESAGYSKATKARLDSSKLQKLGWHARYDIKDGINRTINEVLIK